LTLTNFFPASKRKQAEADDSSSLVRLSFGKHPTGMGLSPSPPKKKKNLPSLVTKTGAQNQLPFSD